MKILGVSPVFGGRKKNLTEFNCIYTNDTHGNLKTLPNLIAGINQKQDELKNKNVITVSSGDDLCYSNLYNPQIQQSRLGLIVKLLNLLNLDAHTPGNHEFDDGIDIFAEQLKKAKFKVVSTNLTNHKLFDERKLVSKSIIISKGKEKYGILGAYAVDNTKHTMDYSVDNLLQKCVAGIDAKQIQSDKELEQVRFNKTLDLINEEIDKLEKQGINKIVLLSHLGYPQEIELVKDKRANGIDIIVGGHSHHKIEGLKTQSEVESGIKTLTNEKDKINVFKTQKGEPVVLTQGECNGNYFGVLKTYFDKNGVIALNNGESNKLFSTANFIPDKKLQQDMQKSIEKTFKNFPYVGKLKNDVTPDLSRFKENTLITYLLDGLKDKLKENGTDVDFLTMNSSIIRYNLTKGTYNEGSLSLPSQFEDKIVYGKITERNIVNAINQMIELGNKRGVPDVPQFTSNVQYTMEKLPENKLKLVGLTINGKQIDVNAPSDNEYNFATSSYMSQGSLAKAFSESSYQDALDKDGNSIIRSTGLAHYIKKFKLDKNNEFDLESNPTDLIKIIDKSKELTAV